LHVQTRIDTDSSARRGLGPENVPGNMSSGALLPPQTQFNVILYYVISPKQSGN